MSLYSEAPALRTFRQDKPTLLVCWWATSFSALMILLRITGRFIRSERLFLEDKIAASAIVPLVLRMACVHFILIYGTNNANFAAAELSPTRLHQKAVASGLVLASRFFYAVTYVWPPPTIPNPPPACPKYSASLLPQPLPPLLGLGAC